MKIIFLMLLFILPCSVCAQNEDELFISEISGGSVLLQSGKEKIKLKMGQCISKKDILFISEGSTMILLEPKNCDRYTMKGSYVGNVIGYMKRDEQNSVKHISKTYFNYLFSRMLNAESYKEKKEISSTSVLRKGESILFSCETVDSLYRVIDSLSTSPVDTIVTIPADSLK